MSKSDIKRNAWMLAHGRRKCGYDWWWHSFTAVNRKTKEEKPFYIEFYTCNPGIGKDKVLLGQKEENKKPSYLMVNVGTWGKDHAQLHRFFAWNDVKIHAKAPYSVLADDCYITETETHGHVKVSKEEASDPAYLCDEGEMSWSLKINKSLPFNVGYGAGSFFRAIKAFEMYWHVEGMKTSYEGEIIYNGEAYDVIKDKSYGYADKNWGKDFTSPWLWLSSCSMYSKLHNKELTNSAFDIGGGRPKVGLIALNRKLLGMFTYEGTDYEFNFSKFWTHTKTVFSCTESDTQIIWHVEQKNRKAKMVTDITCLKDEMLWIKYEAPNGKFLHRKLWNGGNGKGSVKLYSLKGKKETLIDDIEVSRVGCEYGEYIKEEK